MADETVLVTGGGGFIGSRLAHRFVTDDRGSVRALVHHRDGAGTARLARLPIELVEGSVTDRDRVTTAVRGCDVVVHCAGGNRRSITDGTRAVAEAAVAAGVDTFVHMSSASVHGHDFDVTIDESDQPSPDTSYAEWKATAERRLDRTADGTDLSTIIFRPFIVHGPHSQFVTGPLEAIAAGAVLADGGVGSVNQLYIDNLVDAIFLAIDTPGAAGETFLVVDDASLSWRAYYERLAANLDDHPPMQELPRRHARLHNRLAYAAANVTPPVRFVAKAAVSDDLRQLATDEAKRIPWAMDLFASLPAAARESVKRRMDGAGPPVVEGPRDGEDSIAFGYPSDREVSMHSSTGRISNRKAKRVLGWSPRVGLDEGFERIAAWVDYADPVGAGCRNTNG